jgi:hypothetical protein
MQVYKVHLQYSPSFTLSIHPLPPTETKSWSGLVLHSCPSIFKCILIVQSVLSMVFHPSMYCTLISSITLSSSPLPPYYSTAFITFHYTILIHGCNVFWYCKLSFSFPLPPSSSSLKQSSDYMLSLCLSLSLNKGVYSPHSFPI